MLFAQNLIARPGSKLYIWRMNLKWFYGALFLLLAVLGVKMDRTSLSNQEIEVRFAQDEFTQDKAQKALAAVRDQLENVGVENLQIRELEDGGLKITYYSDLAVSEIQQILSESDLAAENSENTPSEFPKKDTQKDLASYELNVYEIQGSSISDLQLEGVPLEITQSKDQLSVLLAFWGFN